MHRLTLSDYLLTILIILVLTFGAAQLLQHWLLVVTEQATTRIDRADQIFP